MPKNPTPPTRREMARQSTRDEILDTARRQMAEQGAASLSLREIARQMRITAPALYRYFASRDDLVTALIVNAFHSFGDTLAAGRDSVPPDDHAARLPAIALAYRSWAIAHPQDYLLIFGTPIPNYHAPTEITMPEAKRAMDILIDALSDAFSADAISSTAVYQKPSTTLQTQLNDWKKRYGYAAKTPVMHLALIAWSRIHGLVSLELIGQLAPFFGDPSELYRTQVIQTLRELGYTIPQKMK